MVSIIMSYFANLKKSKWRLHRYNSKQSICRSTRSGRRVKCPYRLILCLCYMYVLYFYLVHDDCITCTWLCWLIVLLYPLRGLYRVHKCYQMLPKGRTDKIPFEKMCLRPQPKVTGPMTKFVPATISTVLISPQT